MSLWPAPEPALRPPVRLVVLGPHACAYLPGRVSRDRTFLPDRLAPEAYERLMDAGFRRSGKIVYQPVCRSCRACRPIRTPVATFRPGRRFRKCLARNTDLTVEVGPLEATAEKFSLYRHYQQTRHGDPHQLDWPDFAHFLYDSPVDTLEFVYRDASGRLLAVGICDVGPRTLSSMYFFYDTTQPRRSLGVFGALREIDFCRRQDKPYYYLGFHVEGCGAMAYKADFRPCEVLGTDGVWRPADA